MSKNDIVTLKRYLYAIPKPLTSPVIPASPRDRVAWRWPFSVGKIDPIFLPAPPLIAVARNTAEIRGTQRTDRSPVTGPVSRMASELKTTVEKHLATVEEMLVPAGP